MAAVGERAIKKVPALRGKTVVNLFIEPSTRTRTSFELSEQRLSADIVNFTAEAPPLKKGETLKDTARTHSQKGALNIDMIVIRHSALGAPQFPGLPRPQSTPASSTPATARTNTPPRRCWTPSRMRRHWSQTGRHAVGGRRPRRACGSRSPATSCTPGWPAPTSGCCAPSAPRSPSSPRPRCCRIGVEQVAVRRQLRPRRDPRQGRRRDDDAARAGRTDERLVLPHHPRVLAPLGLRRQPAPRPGQPGAQGHHHHAPRVR